MNADTILYRFVNKDELEEMPNGGHALKLLSNDKIMSIYHYLSNSKGEGGPIVGFMEYVKSQADVFQVSFDMARRDFGSEERRTCVAFTVQNLIDHIMTEGARLEKAVETPLTAEESKRLYDKNDPNITAAMHYNVGHIPGVVQHARFGSLMQKRDNGGPNPQEVNLIGRFVKPMPVLACAYEEIDQMGKFLDKCVACPKVVTELVRNLPSVGRISKAFKENIPFVPQPPNFSTNIYGGLKDRDVLGRMKGHMKGLGFSKDCIDTFSQTLTTMSMKEAVATLTRNEDNWIKDANGRCALNSAGKEVGRNWIQQLDNYVQKAVNALGNPNATYPKDMFFKNTAIQATMAYVGSLPTDRMATDGKNAIVNLFELFDSKREADLMRGAVGVEGMRQVVKDIVKAGDRVPQHVATIGRLLNVDMDRREAPVVPQPVEQVRQRSQVGTQGPEKKPKRGNDRQIG